MARLVPPFFPLPTTKYSWLSPFRRAGDLLCYSPYEMAKRLSISLFCSDHSKYSLLHYKTMKWVSKHKGFHCFTRVQAFGGTHFHETTIGDGGTSLPCHRGARLSKDLTTSYWSNTKNISKLWNSDFLHHFVGAQSKDFSMLQNNDKRWWTKLVVGKMVSQPVWGKKQD